MTMRPDILTNSGSYFNFLTPESSDINIEDIATGLSNTCRFAGQCNQFYSVAEHSVLVSLFVPKEYAMQGLLHDAAEAYIGDVTSPLKRLLPEYKLIEKRVHQAIFKRFNLGLDMPQEVKHVDLIMLATEQKCLMPPHDDEWVTIKNITPYPILLEPLPPVDARNLFLDRFEELRKAAE